MILLHFILHPLIFFVNSVNIFALDRPVMSCFPGEKSEPKRSTTNRPRPDDVLHAADVLGPSSPAGANADQQAASASQQDIAAIATAAPEMSADVQKFISFAGNLELLMQSSQYGRCKRNMGVKERSSTLLL